MFNVQIASKCCDNTGKTFLYLLFRMHVFDIFKIEITPSISPSATVFNTKPRVSVRRVINVQYKTCLVDMFSLIPIRSTILFIDRYKLCILIPTSDLLRECAVNKPLSANCNYLIS